MSMVIMVGAHRENLFRTAPHLVNVVLHLMPKTILTTCVNILGAAGSPGRIGSVPLSTPGSAESPRVQTLVILTMVMVM